MENIRCRHLGLSGNSFRYTAGLDAVFGYDIAVDGIFKSLFSHSGLEQVTCFYDPSNYQDAILKKKYRSLSRRRQVDVKLNLYSEFEFWNKPGAPEIEILHSASMEFMPLVYMREFFLRGKCPITYTIHGASYPEYINSFYLMKLLMPFRPYDSLICTSRAVRYAVEEILNNMSHLLKEHNGIGAQYNGRLDVVPLGIDTDIFAPQDKESVRKELQIPGKAFVILWVGRFSAYDKADMYPVLQAYKRLMKKNPGGKLLLVMAGYDRKNLPMLPAMKKHMKALGIETEVRIIENNEVKNRHRLFSAADVFISPIDNIQETFGITPIEAMACGIPQVVSDWDGYRDTVAEGETGFLIPTYWRRCDNDIRNAAMLPSEPALRTGIHHLMLSQSVAMDLNKFEKALQRLIDNPQLRKQMSEKSVKRAHEKFSWQRVMAQYEDLWAELRQIRAQTETTDLRERLTFMQPIYCRAFASYPTTFLKDDTPVYLTEEGKQYLNGEAPLPKQYEIQQLLHENQLAPRLLEFLKPSGNRGVTFNEMGKAFESISPDVIDRSAMWLIKQGFCSLSQSQSEAGGNR